MEQVIIFGLGSFAHMMYQLLEQDVNYQVSAFCVDKAYIGEEKEIFGLPVVAFEELESSFSKEEYGILFCSGYNQMNQIRKGKIENAKKRGYRILGYTHPTAIIQASSIGVGNIFLEGTIAGQNSTIGDGNIFFPMAHVAHDTIVGNYNFFTISCAIAGNVKIHDCCVFGNNCTIKNGIEIREGTLVGAGAYIAHSTEPWSVYVPPRSYKLEGKSSLDFQF